MMATSTLKIQIDKALADRIEKLETDQMDLVDALKWLYALFNTASEQRTLIQMKACTAQVRKLLEELDPQCKPTLPLPSRRTNDEN